MVNTSCLHQRLFSQPSSVVAGAQMIDPTVSNTILFFNESPKVEWTNPETDFLAHNDISSSDSLVSLSAPDVTPVAS